MSWKDKKIAAIMKKRYYEKNKEKAIKTSKQWQIKNRELVNKRSKGYHLKRFFGLTVEQYDQMNKDQDYKCAICGQKETKIDHRTQKVKNLSVDHCHRTGKIRGLLCISCNSMIGHAGLGGDDHTILEKGIGYLKAYYDVQTKTKKPIKLD